MTRYVNLINGIEVPMTESEITARKSEEAEWNNNNTFFSLAMESFRIKRNTLLTETDWTVLPDSPISNKTAWQNYRTELRDLTNGLTTVEQIEAVTWPTKPGA